MTAGRSRKRYLGHKEAVKALRKDELEKMRATTKKKEKQKGFVATDGAFVNRKAA